MRLQQHSTCSGSKVAQTAVYKLLLFFVACHLIQGLQPESSCVRQVLAVAQHSASIVDVAEASTHAEVDGHCNRHWSSQNAGSICMHEPT